MKLSSLFWGVFFVLIGGLFLLNNIGVLNVDWTTVWRLWPMILVLWGLSILVGNQRPPWYAVLLMIVLMVFMVVAFAAMQWWDGDFEVGSGDAVTQTFEEPMAPKTEHATFRLHSGAGKFYIRDTTAHLIKAETEVGFGKYNLSREQSDNSTDVTLDFRGRSRNWNFGRSRNRAEIQLNTAPTWNIYVDVGAASASFDLSPYKVEELRLNAGASSLKVRLGSRSEETRVRIKTGASSSVVEVPESVGCEVRLHTALTGKRMRGFEKISSNLYQTTDFDSATRKIYVEVSAGVSRVSVERY